MDITHDKLIFKVNGDEVLTMACALLQCACDEYQMIEHWKTHGVNVWKENTKYQTSLAKALFISIGRMDYYESRMRDAEKYLTKLIEKKPSERT